MSDRVYIFDTTLRDGEQSPGCSMTVPEKLRMASKLVELGVDILEAGFPIASQGDFDAVDAVELARSYVDDVEFSAEDATRTDADYLEQVSRAVVAAGARTVNLPDTVGFSVPDEYGTLIRRMSRALVDTAVVSVHCHDDLGLAVANSIVAVQNGARQIECTMNGLGERAGNC